MNCCNRIFLYGFFLFFSIITIKGQNNFVDGYVINNNKDTVFGYIGISDFSSNSVQCKFKRTLESNVDLFKPFDIHSYRLKDGKYYISKTVDIKDNKENLFLEFLIKGKLNIYFTRFDGDDYYFVEKTKDSLIYLDNSKIYYEYDNIKMEWVVSQNETVQKVGNSNKYKGKLLYVTSDAPQMRNRVSQLNLSHKSIIKFSKDYHNLICNGDDCIIFEKRSKSYISLGAIASNPFYKYGNAHTTIRTPFKFNQVSIPGIFVKMQSGVIHENVQLKACFYFDKIDEQIIEENEGASLKGLGITIPSTLQYTLPFKGIKPYANAGVVIHFLSNPEFHRLVLSDGEITGKSSNSQITTNYKRLNIGGSFAAGFNVPIKNIVFDFGASYDMYFSSESLKILRPFFSVGYIFK